ncbi:hypothetical protein KSS87_018149 [Heliosperma pusillum]|nr:hypothetical protein KSS87_018149 [Heliosperma pusillum]
MALSLKRYAESRPLFDTGLYRLLTERINKERENSVLISITTNSGHLLPENLLFEILSWLPVKDVLRYKSVSKSWYATISSPHFISNHLKNNHNNNQSCILAQYYLSQGELLLEELLIDETPRVLASQVVSKSPVDNTRICGPCDGLYYCSERALWNPAINELRTLPPIIAKPNPPPNTVYSCHDIYGFGSDPLTGDYKVVVIKDYWSTNDEIVSYPASVLVFSLRTDSWKYCGDLTQEYYLEHNKCYIFVKGCCFWRASSLHTDENYSEVIISFDMASHSFQEIHGPENPDIKQLHNRCLGIYDDSLGFFSVFDGILNIWTLNHEAWTKKFTIGLGCVDDFWPVGHWMNNKVLIERRGGKLVLCDPITQELKDLGFEGGRELV